MILNDKLIKEFGENMEKLVIEKWIGILEETGELVINGFFSVKVLERRKGKLNGFGKDGNIIYKNRLKFTTAKRLKDRLCK